MDPDAALQTIRDAIKKLEGIGNPVDADEVTGPALDAFQALDGWITKGGFLPAAWRATVGAHYEGMAST